MSTEKNSLQPNQDQSSFVYSKSPQGFIIQTDPSNGKWRQLILAEHKNNDDPDHPKIEMGFLNLIANLQSAFQTNQQFLVISWNKPQTIGEKDGVLYGEDAMAENFLDQMAIDSWVFSVDVPNTAPNEEFKNILIFKFCKGTLVDCINDTGKWTNPEVFNNTDEDSLLVLQKWVTNYLEVAIQKSKNGDTNYDNFNRIIQDESWNGILMLKCDIDIFNFPSQLEGLLHGIDLNQFHSHHLGIEVAAITGDLNNQSSIATDNSLFGLIDYIDPTFEQFYNKIDVYLKTIQNPPKSYCYKVLSLRVLFENSAIKKFNSYVQLDVNKEFKSETELLNNYETIIFEGSFQKSGELANYTFPEIDKQSKFYTDNLIPLSKWPNINSQYSFEVIDDAIHLKIDLLFDASAYSKTSNSAPSPQQLALADLGIYAAIYYQLIQPDVIINFRTTLYTNSDYPDGVPLSSKQPLADLVGTILAYLSHIADDTKPQTTIPAPWTISSIVEASNRDHIYELITELNIIRTANIDPDVKNSPTISSVINIIPPKIDETSTNESLENDLLLVFAENFENTFKNKLEKGVFSKIAKIKNHQDIVNEGDEQRVWVISFDAEGHHGVNLFFNQLFKESFTYYYSPRPLSTSLLTLNKVPITPYVSGTSFIYDPTATTQDFISVDLDKWALTCLQAIDDFLSPQFSLPASLIENGILVKSILENKNKIANYISSTLTNVLNKPLDKVQIQHVQNIFNQQLHNRLSNAYYISTIVQHPLIAAPKNTNSQENLNFSNVNHPIFYGSINGLQAELLSNERSEDYEIPEYSFENGKIHSQNRQSWLSYCLYLEDALQVSNLNFQKIDFCLTSITQPIQRSSKEEAEQESDRLTFVIPHNNQMLTIDGSVNIPVPLRDYPNPPSIISQFAGYSNSISEEITAIKEALLWTFAFEYIAPESNQDIMNVQVTLNKSSSQTFSRSVASSVIFENSLAQFIKSLPQLKEDFEQYVTALTSEDITQNTRISLYAKAAVKSLVALTDLVTNSWSTHHQDDILPPLLAENKSENGINNTLFNFSIKETSKNEDLASPLIITITADKANPIEMENLLVEITGYQSEIISSGDGVISYNFKDNNERYLSYKNRQIVRERSFKLLSLNLMQYQEAVAGLQVMRNSKLSEMFETNPLFVYQTPWVHAANSVTPMLVMNEPIDISAITTGQAQSDDLAVQLQRLFEAIFKDYSFLNSPTIRLETSYSYNLSQTESFGQMDLPVSLINSYQLNLPADLEIGNIKIDGKTEQSFLSAFADNFKTWFKEIMPNTQNAKLNLKITIYSAIDGTTPIIRLNNFLSINNIKDL